MKGPQYLIFLERGQNAAAVSYPFPSFLHSNHRILNVLCADLALLSVQVEFQIYNALCEMVLLERRLHLRYRSLRVNLYLPRLKRPQS